MKRKLLVRIAIVACCFVAATALLAAQTAPAPRTGTVTVGDFVVRLAGALNPGHQEIKNLDQAKLFFANQGIVLPADLNLSATLTQKDVVAVTSLLGVKVNTQEPGKTFRADSVEGFVGFLRDGIDAGRIPVEPVAGSANRSPFAPAEQGACCHGTTCTQEAPSNCTGGGGISRGKGTSCSSDPCAPGKGVCCVDHNTFTITDASGCSGVFTGKDSCIPYGEVCNKICPPGSTCVATPTEP